MNTPKAMYFVTFTVANGGLYSAPVSMDEEINSNQALQALSGEVIKFAVSQGYARSVDAVTITSISLLNPGRDVEVVANEMLESAFVELYESIEDGEVSNRFEELYLSITNRVEVANG